MDKLYCYVDETGQDTKGALFIGSVIVAQKDRDELIKLLERIEKQSGKYKTKWQKTALKIKKSYLKIVFEQNTLKDKLYFSLHTNSLAYKELTVLTIAAALNVSHDKKIDYKATIFIDGLPQSEILTVGVQLRRLGIHTEKVRGLKDENNALIRLADAVAGFVREVKSKEIYTEDLYKKALKSKLLREV
jgi:hypothetical protein